MLAHGKPAPGSGLRDAVPVLGCWEIPRPQESAPGNPPRARRLGTTVMLGRMVVGRPANEDGRRWGRRSAMVQKPPGNGTVAPDGDDLHLEAVTVEGIGTVLVLDVRGRLGEVAEPGVPVRAARPGGGACRCGVRHVGGDGAGWPTTSRSRCWPVSGSRWSSGPACPSPWCPCIGSCARRWRRDRTAGPLDGRTGAEAGARSAADRPWPPSVVRRSLEPDPRSAWRCTRRWSPRRATSGACPPSARRPPLWSASWSRTRSRTPAATWGCRWRGGGAGVSLAVRDASSERPQPQPVEASRPRGRGLLLVATLADAWGVLPTGDGGKVVWAVLRD